MRSLRFSMVGCWGWLFSLLFLWGYTLHAAPLNTRPIEGLRDKTPEIHALVGARIVIAPGQVLEKGTVVLRNGIVEAVGANVQPPADAHVWDVTGKTIYPGLIDAYTEVRVNTSHLRNGSPYWNSQISPQLDMAQHYESDKALNEKLRGQGITTRLVAPVDGIIKGRSVLVTTRDEPIPRAIIRDRLAQHIHLYVSRSPRREAYPNSPMGAVALARQALYDAQWYRAAWNAHRGNTRLHRPERNDALEAMQTLSEGRELVIMDADSELYLLRAERFAREFSLNIALRGSGREYRRLNEIVATGRPIIVPVSFPKPPNVSTAEAVLNAAVEDMLHWDFAPENPARLEKAGVRMSLTSHGLSDVNQFLGAVRKAVERGLTKDGALRALTTAPAELLGVSELVGTVQVGKIANLLLTDGDLFDKKTKVLETWVDGERYEILRTPRYDLRGVWSMTLPSSPTIPKLFVELTGTPSDLKGRIGREAFKLETKAAEPKTSEPKNAVPRTAKEPKDEQLEDKGKAKKLERLSLRETHFNATFDGGEFGKEGTAHLSVATSLDDSGTLRWLGDIVWADETRAVVSGQREQPLPADAEKSSDSNSDKSKEEKSSDDAAVGDKKKHDPKASFEVNYPLGAFGRRSPPEQPKLVLFQNATVWTCGPAGILENASVLMGEGKILAVGRDVTAPPGATVIDAKGKHISPGIIDCHSHAATDGGVNETGQAITCEVRIGDFIDANDVNIYRQLAGGVTAINILHGSANAIGGQNELIKLRWGGTPDQLRVPAAPPTVKFALGENPKQSNWGDSNRSRYPQTRMGVEQLIRDEFQAAKEYKERWDRWSRDHEGLPPRRDLELDCIVEILEAKRWIHCHSYRQDEILAFLRTMEGFNVKVGVLQHILEGYKVADEIAKHGAMSSAFSDWWAYKFEVWDAIPYNGALMHNRGIVVTFNSDDREMARHLNQEAAKAVRYGNVPPAEALKFVTLNAAKQLKIDHLVGSIEAGKEADLVLWNTSPLSNFAKPEQTWIEGGRYFDIEEDLKLRDEIRQMRVTLVQKILASGDEMRHIGEDYATDKDLWPSCDEYCHAHPNCRVKRNGK